MAACKQCELSRVKGVIVTVCGARKTQIVEVEQTPTPIEEISQTELLSELNDIDNEEAE